jgi:hypothetical protein
MTAAELESYPEYPYVTWDLKPASKGKVTVAVGRGGPFEISYEIHGTGPTHLVVCGTPTLLSSCPLPSSPWNAVEDLMVISSVAVRNC